MKHHLYSFIATLYFFSAQSLDEGRVLNSSPGRDSRSLR